MSPAIGYSDGAETYLRGRYGAYKGHFAWRELEEAFNAGAALPPPGRGMVPMTEEEKCETCGGRGQLLQRERVGESDFNEWELDCPVCDGAGHAPGHIQSHVAFLNDRMNALKRECHDWWTAASKAGVQWQPIETAPKDGTNILLYAPPQEFEGKPIEERITQGYWSEPSDTPRIKYQDGFAPEPEWDEWEPYWASSDGGFTEENPPTHWIPLPKAPAHGIKEGGNA